MGPLVSLDRHPKHQTPCHQGRTRSAGLNYALNREALVRGIFKGFARPARGPAPPSYPAYNDALRGYPYDPARARALLAAAGHGAGLRVKAMMPTGGITLVQEMTQSIQADLRRVGIDVTYDALEPNAYFTRVRSGLTDEYIFAVSWWGADFLTFLEQQFAQNRWPPNGVNRGWYANPEVDRLLHEGRTEPDAAKRRAIYQRAEQLIVNDAPWLFTVYFRSVGLRSRRVQNVRQGLFALDYAKAWLGP